MCVRNSEEEEAVPWSRVSEGEPQEVRWERWRHRSCEASRAMQRTLAFTSNDRGAAGGSGAEEGHDLT